MKQRLTILLLIILLSESGFCSTMRADTVVCDSGQLIIDLACIPTFDGKPMLDGDLIFVNYDDGMYTASDSLYYNSISVNSVTLQGIFMENTDNLSASMNFSYYSDSGACLTSLVNFHIEEAATSYCYMRIDSLVASAYTIGYPSNEVCLGMDTISPVTNAPDNSIIYNSGNLSCLDIDGVINTGNCRAGNYTITFSSDYCLSSYSADITVSEPDVINVEDTITICSGDPMYTNSPYSNYVFYTPGNSEGNHYGDLLTEGIYIIGSDSSYCVIPDTAYVEIGEAPPIGIDLTEECDRVIVRYNNTLDRVLDISWSNGGYGDEIEIYDDATIGIEVTDEWGCSSSDTIPIVRHPLGIPSVQLEKEDASCWVDGNISISSASVINNVGETRYQLRNTINGRVYNTVENIPEGIYSLEVVDQRECVASYNDPITIIQRCLEDFPVFTPNGDNIEDSYFIPHEGSVKIYNLDGKLVRELNTPAYWDGNDGAANSLPMGTYVIISDNDRIVNITIVR